MLPIEGEKIFCPRDANFKHRPVTLAERELFSERRGFFQRCLTFYFLFALISCTDHALRVGAQNTNISNLRLLI